MSSKAENDHLLIVAQGRVADSEEHKLLSKRFCDEIVKYRHERIVIDVSKIHFPNSLELHNDVVDF
jgi:anti-anti-sigma regulatory factor